MLANPRIGNNAVPPFGFTLLEVLITLIVLSVGLLGLAGLQTLSLRNNHEAYLRSQVISQTYDIVDRMRANAGQVTAYMRDKASYEFGKIGALTADCDKQVGCGTAQMAEHDLYNWNIALKNALPQGIGIVCRDSASSLGDGSYEIEDGSYEKGTLTTGCTNLPTDPLVVKIWWVNDRAAAPVPTLFSTTIGEKL